MVLNIAYFFLIGTLFFVLYYDIKKRTIHFILPLLIFFLATLINYMSISLRLSDIVYNISFVLINIFGVTLYFSLKAKALVNPVNDSIGLGDIVFFIAITPLFNLKTFILFFIIGLLFSLLIHGIALLFKKAKTIPLAGYLSLFLVISLLMKNVFNINITL